MTAHKRNKAMVQRPYAPDSVKAAPTQQHPIVRNLGGYAIGNPALRDIIAAADELAEKLGKAVDRLTDDEARQAIEAGQRRYRAHPA